MARVVYDRVWKRYGANAVLQDLNLDVQDGEFLVLVGPSGSGKSTALRMLAGLEEISEGQIVIGDRPVNDLPPKDRDVAMVFQSYALYPHMNVFDNLAYSLKMRHHAKSDVERRVREAARMLDIEPLLDRKPKQLSGGQRQRVALGRAIVRDPRVFLMDEPLSNLDAKLRLQTRAELIKLHQRLGTTTIYVTHDQVEAMTMGDRIAVLNFGRLQQLDTPDRLYRHPANVFVAGFIGSPSMNFFDMRVGVANGRLVLRGERFVLTLSAADASALRRLDGSTVTVGIRPEHVVERRLEGDQEAGAIHTVVDVVETLGAEQYVYLDAGIGTAIVARMAPDVKLVRGQPLDIVLPPEHLYFFDPASGDAIMCSE